MTPVARHWRRWQRRWHRSVLAALRSPPALPPPTLPIASVAERQQPWLSRIYGWVVARKRAREAAAAVRIAPPLVPVLSVGNVTFGATGKTPCVLYLVDYVLTRSRRPIDGNGSNQKVPLMLARGYGDDEWRLLARRFPACELAVGADRVRVGAAKVQELGGDAAALSCVVLDDGLQQWRLAKDLEIVMIDALHPFGNGLLLPCGSLRELPHEALARADVVIVHHADLLGSDEQTQTLLSSLRSLLDAKRKPVIATSRMKVVALVPATQLLSPTSKSSLQAPVGHGGHVSLDGCMALVLCGVGNPESVQLVVQTLARWKRVEVEAFPDHHVFSDGDVQDVLQLTRELQSASDSHVVVVTTEKDLARSPHAMETLAQTLDLRVLQCELELLHNAQEVERLVDACLDGDSRLEERISNKP
ncbi:hypothetical protein BBJ28_00025565 [Nothophytophthora sp. Chile5]|nr:hypothetical protein BBJ28_00025565 [Nothophytophthora sp. Chile5]